MYRMVAISAVIFSLGSTPPAPGLAPWLNLISMARMAGCSATSALSRGRLNRPSSSRQPK